MYFGTLLCLEFVLLIGFKYTGNTVRAGIRFAALGGACLQAPAENRDKKDIDCFHVFTY